MHYPFRLGQRRDAATGLPFFARAKNDQGRIVLRIKFGDDGKVVGVQIVSHQTSEKLAEYTRKYVLENWSSGKEAGKTITTPIIYRARGK